MLKNKRGGEKILSIWWFFVLTIVGLGISFGVFLFYSVDIDVRKLEADILSSRILDCVIRQGILIDEAFENDFDIFQKCNLNKDSLKEDFYFEIQLFKKSPSETATPDLIKVDNRKGSNGGDNKKKTLEEILEYVKNNPISNGEVDKKCNCGDNCDNYAGWIAKASNKEDILDSKLLLAIMMQESNCGADEHSGSSIGLMQINLIHCGKYGLTKNKGECENELLSDPELNIGLGAKILKINYNSHSGGKQFSKACTDEFKKKYYSGWKAALRGYNGWGCNPDYPKQDNYVEYVTNLHERLKEISGEEATVDPDKIIVSGNDFKVECLLTQDNERGKKAEAKNWLKCISRSESILYYDDGRLKEGTIKISTGSNNKGRRVS